MPPWRCLLTVAIRRLFEDEFAYISQSYYADLFFAGQFDDWKWLDLPAYDLPPLPNI